MVGIGVIKQSTANTVDVANAAIALTEKVNKNLPAGMKIHQSYNSAVFIEASIREVFNTLFIAVGCVILAIYLFLGNVRAMLIPAVTVPVSLVATFIVIYGFGFSVNLLTLLALVLAIGMVVDDAIVMLENIVRRMQEYNEKPLVAAFKGARQVGFAVIATTLVLISVFVPITFLKGDLGRLFTEFAITIAAAVGFSSLVALTLCPMLASKILSAEKMEPNILVRWIDAGVRCLRRLYMALLKGLIKVPAVMVIIFMLLASSLYFIHQEVPSEFVPKEDRGAFFISVKGPEGASFSYMEEYID
jgi:multidrug efflux pump